MRKYFFLFLSCLLLSGCVTKTEQPPKDSHTNPPPVVENQKISLLDYFPKTPIDKFFIGIGNEFAQYTEKFYPNEGPYYPAVMDNGGNRFFRIYKVTDQEIALVYEQPDFYEDDIPTPSSFEGRFIIQPLLRFPLNVGEKVGQWKITSLTEKLTLPIGEFSNVLVIQKVNEDGSIVRQYWAKEYGKIKDEFLFKDTNGDLYEVSSELQNIK
ncbi:hypothetical protein [Neobacillus sp. D3-1R]|uniref:hypothetical protein n=1 Tax=Neobacillus sp. D3-1R TaxID=3445778 RepID=UPI003F9FC399